MNQERVWIDEDWKAYLRPTFDGDTSGYIRADLVQAKDAEIARLRAELDAAQAEVQALIAANYRKLVAEITGNPSGTRCDACRSCGYYHCVDAFSGCAGMRDYTLDEATTAREARDAQMRAEGRVAGLREAAEIAGLNAWKHAGEDDYSRGMDAGAAHQVKACCDAIRAHADKIEGDTVKTGGHNRECGE